MIPTGIINKVILGIISGAAMAAGSLIVNESSKAVKKKLKEESDKEKLKCEVLDVNGNKLHKTTAKVVA